MRTAGWLLIVLAAISLTWFLASERTAQRPEQTVETKPAPQSPLPETAKRIWFGPVWGWTTPADKTFALARGEASQFPVFTQSQYRVQLDSTMPVNLTTPCGSEPQVLQTERDCLTPGAVVIADSRDANMGTVKAAVGVYMRNSELVNTAVTMNRVHVRMSEYKCVAHCPNGEFISPTSK